MGKVTSGIDLFESQIDQLIQMFPKLKSGTTENDVTIVQGELDVIDITGKLWETYQVEIHPSDGFPYRFPHVFETGGKIPRIADWHIYEDTNSCCLAVEPEERLACRNGITLTAFVTDYVLPYFFNQTFRKVEGYYKNGEYSHGLKGIYEYYDGTLQTNGDIQETIRLMIIVADSVKPGRTHECFCGSKKKFRKCHRDAYEKLSMLGRSVLRAHAHDFSKAIREQ